MNDIKELLHIMQRLRDPQTGCPWDIQQDFHSIAPYTVEEAYEVADAIERNDNDDLRDELGDLLFQVVFHSQMAQEQGLFGFNDVVHAINEKMLRRHPHVFSDAKIDTAEEQIRAWENHKQLERQNNQKYSSVLDGVAKSLPGVTRAAKIQKRAAKVGFDWDNIKPVIAKLEEECLELKAELRVDAPRQRIEDELGDIIFTVVNIARHLDVDPELAIRKSTRKFESRFRKLEQSIRVAGENIANLPIDRLEAYWQQAKLEDNE